MTDGVFRRDGAFVAAPPHHPTVLESAWQRAVLASLLTNCGDPLHGPDRPKPAT